MQWKRQEVIQMFWKEVAGKRILQCHSRGDGRFTPFNCYVEAFGRKDSIENHYQCAKVFDIGELVGVRQELSVPKDWRQAKNWKSSGCIQVGWKIGGHNFDIKLNTSERYSFALDDWGIQYYIMLWYKYLRGKPELIRVASEFDGFEDIFKGKPPKQFPFCQADVIEKVVGEGLESLRPMCKELWDYLVNHK